MRHYSDGNLLPPISSMLLASFAAGAVRHDFDGPQQGDRRAERTAAFGLRRCRFRPRMPPGPRPPPTGWRQDRTTVSGHTA